MKRHMDVNVPCKDLNFETEVKAARKETRNYYENESVHVFTLFTRYSHELTKY